MSNPGDTPSVPEEAVRFRRMEAQAGKTIPTPPPLTASDAAEIERFKSYLRAIAAWDNANDDLPDWAPITDLEKAMYEKKRLKAHFAIYERIYVEEPPARPRICAENHRPD